MTRKASLMASFVAVITIIASADATAAKKVQITSIPASDSRITYVGRTIVSADTVRYDWSGVYCKVKFTGPELTMKCGSSRAAYLNVWIDKQPVHNQDELLVITSKDTVVTVVSNAGKGEHEVLIQKRSEGEQGDLSITRFSAKGEFLQASGLKDRHIEFIGDSYTCGYGTEPSVKSDPFKVETENCNLAYGPIISRYFGCDYDLISHSGRGVIRNYGGYNPNETMLHKYDWAMCMNSASWDFDKTPYTPDLVIIYLGTNDFSCGEQPSMGSWCDKYKELVGKVRSHYGDNVPILCVASKADEMMREYVQTAAEKCGYANVWWTSCQSMLHDMEGDLGASWHPNYKGQRKLAMSLIPYVSTLTGWSLEDRVVE